MSNCQTFNLPALEVELHQVTEALRCVLHTILFNRALGFVRPKDVDSELFDVTYVHCGDQDVDEKVEAKIKDIQQFLDKRTSELTQVCLSFYEKRTKQGWLGTQDEKLYWEQWCINILLLQPDVSLQQQHTHSDAQRKRQLRLQANIEELMSYIIRCVNDKKDHIPPVVTSTAVTFPFDIAMIGSSRSAYGLQAMKKMLMQTSPPPVLS